MSKQAQTAQATEPATEQLIIRQPGRCAYQPTWQAMLQFTDNRDQTTPDEIWLLEHDPVFSQGQAGKPEHLLDTGDIPVVQADRGGQVTYHGPGQLVAYLLIDLRRRKLGVRDLVTLMEQSLIELLAESGITAYAKADAPGVYVDTPEYTGAKIASLGLRVRRGCSFHGLALNVDMDLTPFKRINPCGYPGLEMCQSRALGGPQTVSQAAVSLARILARALGYPQQNQQRWTELPYEPD